MTKWCVNTRRQMSADETTTIYQAKAFTYTFNMIDYVDSFLVNCYQNGNILLLKQTHKTSNWLLHLAVEEGSTVCVCSTLMLFL